MKKLHDKVAIITGASGGLGKATAIAFAREGANVAMCARTLDKLQLTSEACREHGVETLAIKADVMVYEDLQTLVEETTGRFGKVGEQGLKDMTPLGYIGDPDEDIAPAAVFLASDDARYITGQMIKVDGGSDIHF